MIMGPGCATEAESQAKANYVSLLQKQEKDCVATVGPHRTNLVGLTNTETQTTNLINTSVHFHLHHMQFFDSGYKYQYDRFNNEFRYVPTNADVAGLDDRTSSCIIHGSHLLVSKRGVINNAVKLAYNPNKAQRDRLYPARINSFITHLVLEHFSSVIRLLLYASAFDRINVRRLFLTIRASTCKEQQKHNSFELNDELTRANFRNIVEPYLP